LTRGMSIRIDSGHVKEDFARTLHEGGGSDGRAVTVDASGYVYVVGNLGAVAQFNGTVWSGIGQHFLAKYHPSGTLVWLRRYSVGFLRAIVVDASGAIFAAGGTSAWDYGDTLLVKFDPAGTVLWARTYDNGTYTDVAMGVAVSASGDIFLGGV